MNHLIKLSSSFLCAAVVLVSAGCGESGAEKAAKEKERQRVELEKQAIREQQQGSKAISEIEKKIGRKPRPLDLNLHPEKKTETAPAAPPKS